MTCRFATTAFLILFTFTTLSAQDHPQTWIHGNIIGDYFNKVYGDPSTSPGQYGAASRYTQAFQFRRFYLFVDHTFDERFSSQFLLEGNDKSLDPGGKYDLFVKTAYVQWKGIFPGSNLQVGLIPTPAWIYVTEKIWNYRSIEKTIADFRKLGVATDAGISLRGRITGDDMLSYHIMYGNGSGQAPDSNNYRKYYASLTFRPVPEVTVDGYIDHEPGGGASQKTTLKGFVSYQDSAFTVGVEVVHQLQQYGLLYNTRPFGYSTFGWARLVRSPAINVFARYDHFDPNLDAQIVKPIAENFYTAGFDYMPIPTVHFMPNIWINTYDVTPLFGGGRPADIVLRLTFFVVYE